MKMEASKCDVSIAPVYENALSAKAFTGGGLISDIRKRGRGRGRRKGRRSRRKGRRSRMRAGE